MSTQLDRRALLRSGLAAGGGLLSLGALERLGARQAKAAVPSLAASAGDGYGPLAPAADDRGREILALPAGFSYVTFGEIGARMSDGNRTPLALDGMAAFGVGNHFVLIRNHEDRNAPGAGSVPTDERSYDPQAGGGCSALELDPRRATLLRDWIAMGGTTVNCAGGIGFGGRSWITCEETVAGPEHSLPARRFPRRHGYCYEVDARRGPGRPQRAEPIRAMGRFFHEALAVDQRTGIVHLTEDPGSAIGAGFYRYVPQDPRRLDQGGRLGMLAVRRAPQRDMREGQAVGDALAVEWVDIDSPDPDYEADDDPRSVFNQGFARGGARFNRLEGCWYDEGSVFFVSTSGGDAKSGDVNADGFAEGFGQVWEYRPHPRHGGLLTLIFESPSGAVLDSPDNLTVTPRGGLILCEDDASSADGDGHPLAPGIANVNRLIGLSPDGDPFELAVNRLNDAELAGACFSPDGRWLFVNIFGDSAGTIDEHAGTGMTCAITGPWHDGPL